jgi:predicted DNA binding CopG/RHH family protein
MPALEGDMNEKFQKIRDYADSHDLSEEIEKGHWEADVADDPMITTSLRLPKSLLDWVRAQAAEQHVKPTAWIRELLEQQRSGQPDLEHRVSALEAALSSVKLGALHQPSASAGAGVTRAAKAAKGRKTRIKIEQRTQEHLDKVRRMMAAHNLKRS